MCVHLWPLETLVPFRQNVTLSRLHLYMLLLLINSWSRPEETHQPLLVPVSTSFLLTFDCSELDVPRGEPAAVSGENPLTQQQREGGSFLWNLQSIDRKQATAIVGVIFQRETAKYPQQLVIPSAAGSGSQLHSLIHATPKSALYL